MNFDDRKTGKRLEKDIEDIEKEIFEFSQKMKLADEKRKRYGELIWSLLSVFIGLVSVYYFSSKTFFLTAKDENKNTTVYKELDILKYRLAEIDKLRKEAKEDIQKVIVQSPDKNFDLKIVSIQANIRELESKQAKLNSDFTNRLENLEIILKNNNEGLVRFHNLQKDVNYLQESLNKSNITIEKLRDTLYDFYKWIIGLIAAILIPNLIKIFSATWENVTKKKSQ